MELSLLLNSAIVTQVIGKVERKDISGITYDSRKVIEGNLFVAIKGNQADGHKYITDAIAKGASAVVVEDDISLPDELLIHQNVAKILVPDSRAALAVFSSAFYHNPSEELSPFAVTGTNGKTSSAWLIKHFLESCGKTTGMLGTIANYIANEKIEASLTTPESSDLNKMFRMMLDQHCTHCVMEVSSHALALHRVHGIHFRGAIFTNLTQDHLDYHGTMEDYLSAKKILFDQLPASSFAVINCDDPYYREIIKDTEANIYTYGIAKDADYRIDEIKFDLNGTHFTLTHLNQQYYIHTKLVGVFNAYNVTAAIALCHLNGCSIETMNDSLTTMPQIPGRFEMIRAGKKYVIVDYSHTPDSLEKALENIRRIIGRKQPLITVFGCGGDRDRGKRPLMGKIASELSDTVIITNDNPRTENELEIIEEIRKGIISFNYVIEPDREKAIQKAIIDSADDAVILCAGKGHEDYQIIGTERIHFSDKEICLKYLCKVAV